MEEIEEKKTERRIVWESMVSFLVFISIWTIWIIGKRRFPVPDIIDGILGFGDLIWMGSGAALICLNRKHLHINPKKMMLSAPGWRRLGAMLLLVILYYIAVMFNSYGRLYWKPDGNIVAAFATFLIVGFQEELVFRGYFLNTLARAMTERKANVLSAFYFLLIHLPGWILKGVSLAGIAGMGAGVFLLGLFFGYGFRKDQTIWTPTLLHMVWDVFTTVV